MLKHLHPFGGSGSLVLKLIKSGSIDKALLAYKLKPDSVGAVVLIHHFSKRYIFHFLFLLIQLIFSDDKNLDQVESIYNVLIQSKIVPDEALIGTLINVGESLDNQKQQSN